MHHRHHIRPLSSLSLAEVEDIARGAADRGESLEAVNHYPSGTEQHARFAHAYRLRECDLNLALA